MVQTWVLVGLVISAFGVSTLGAFFSIIGIGKLFSGAVLAVWLMAASLELAKFTIAAFLHQVWDRLNQVLKTYLLVAVVALSLITSMGIFGFLSAAYQASSATLEREQIKLRSLQDQASRNSQELARLNKSIEEIPLNYISKKMKARTEAEPLLRDLTKDSDRIARETTEANLIILEIQGKIGPLIYIARMFGADVDSVVKYLILLLVAVFDPLAICLVIAISDATKQRKIAKALEQRGHHPGQERLNQAVQSLKMRFSNEEKSGSG
jgi:hypothetical protein